MRNRIISTLKALGVKSREDILINEFTVDIFGSQSGEKIINAMYKKDLSSQSLSSLKHHAMENNLLSKYGLLFFDESTLRLLVPIIIPTVKEFNDVVEFSDYLKNKLDYDNGESESNTFSITKAEVPPQFLDFYKSLLKTLNDNKFFKDDPDNQLNLELAIDFLDDLPNVKKHNGLKITLVANTEYLEGGSQKRIYSFTFNTQIAIPALGFKIENGNLDKLGECNFQSSIIYDQGNFTYGRGDETRFFYPNGNGTLKEYAQMLKVYQNEFEPLIESSDRERLNVEIR